MRTPRTENLKKEIYFLSRVKHNWEFFVRTLPTESSIANNGYVKNLIFMRYQFQIFISKSNICCVFFISCIIRIFTRKVLINTYSEKMGKSYRIFLWWYIYIQEKISCGKLIQFSLNNKIFFFLFIGSQWYSEIFIKHYYDENSLRKHFLYSSYQG